MKITTKYSKGGKAVGVKKKSATMHIPATPAGSNKARIAAIGTPKKSGTKAAVVMKKGGTKKPLKKAQDGTTMQGPLTEGATKSIKRIDYIHPMGPTADGSSYGSTTPNYDEAQKRIITEANLNPKNSKKLSRGQDRKVEAKAYGKRKNVKALDSARKADGMKKWSKNERNEALLALGVGLGAPALTMLTNNPISKAFKNAWNLEKKNGGAVKKTTAKKTMVRSKKK